VRGGFQGGFANAHRGWCVSAPPDLKSYGFGMWIVLLIIRDPETA